MNAVVSELCIISQRQGFVCRNIWPWTFFWNFSSCWSSGLRPGLATEIWILESCWIHQGHKNTIKAKCVCVFWILFRYSVYMNAVQVLLPRCTFVCLYIYFESCGCRVCSCASFPVCWPAACWPFMIWLSAFVSFLPLLCFLASFSSLHNSLNSEITALAINSAKHTEKVSADLLLISV